MDLLHIQRAGMLWPFQNTRLLFFLATSLPCSAFFNHFLCNFQCSLPQLQFLFNFILFILGKCHVYLFYPRQIYLLSFLSLANIFLSFILILFQFSNHFPCSFQLALPHFQFLLRLLSFVSLANIFVIFSDFSKIISILAIFIFSDFVSILQSLPLQLPIGAPATLVSF